MLVILDNLIIINSNKNNLLGGIMKLVRIKKNLILKILMIFVFIVVVTKITTTFGMQHYYNLDFTTGLVTASSLNVRSGPRN